MLQHESNLIEALALAEESYIIASKHYSPAHKMVLEASVPLISCLIDMKDYSTADTYCRMNYSNVIDPMNAGEYGDKDRMNLMNQLVSIWLEKEPDDDEIVEKALADEAIDLSRKILEYAYTANYSSMQFKIKCLSKLCRVLLKGNELTEETEGLLHQLVTKCIAENNKNGDFIHYSIIFLHRFHSKRFMYFRIEYLEIKKRIMYKVTIQVIF